MTKHQIFSLLLILSMLAPILSSVYRLDVDIYELTEKMKESEKRESESKDEIDNDKKFPILSEAALKHFNHVNSNSTFHKKGIKDLHYEVLTPPPEFI